MNGLSSEAVQLLADIAAHPVEEFEPAVRGCLKLLRDVTGLESTMLLVLDYESDELLQRATYVDVTDDHVIPIVEGNAFPWLSGGCRLLRESGRHYSEDMLADYPNFELGVTLGLHGYLSVPIEIGPEQRLAGTLCGMHPDVFSLSDEAVGFARLLAQLIALRLEREAHIAATKATAERAGDVLDTWVQRAVEHEHHVRTDLMVIAGLIALVRTGGPEMDVPELLTTAAQRLESLGKHVDRFVAGMRDSIQNSAQHDHVNVVELVYEAGGVYGGGGLDQAREDEAGPSEVWVWARPEVVRSLLRLLLGDSNSSPDVPALEFREDPGAVLIMATGPLQFVSMSVLRALVASLGGEMALETLADGTGRIEVSLPTVPPPLRL